VEKGIVFLFKKLKKVSRSRGANLTEKARGVKIEANGLKGKRWLGTCGPGFSTEAGTNFMLK